MLFTYRVASRKDQFGEWKVLCFKNGKRYPEGDGFETSKADAQQTMAYLQKAEAERFLLSTFIPLAELVDAAKHFDENRYHRDLCESMEQQYGPYEDAVQDEMLRVGPDWSNAGASFATSGESLCQYLGGHDIRDCSSAGPDSGNMDHECVRCGRYFSVPLY